MMGALLLRGLMAGLIAGLIGFGFAELAGEPLVGQAVVLEATAAAQRGETPEPVLVSREVQSGWGLFTGIMVYATALGGLFSLAFAFAWGRLAWNDARILAAILAVGALLAIAYCPALKYPPNPPSVGRPETIRLRTALYFAMVAAVGHRRDRGGARPAAAPWAMECAGIGIVGFRHSGCNHGLAAAGYRRSACRLPGHAALALSYRRLGVADGPVAQSWPGFRLAGEQLFPRRGRIPGKEGVDWQTMTIPWIGEGS
jgi:hypothetical protein